MQGCQGLEVCLLRAATSSVPQIADAEHRFNTSWFFPEPAVHGKSFAHCRASQDSGALGPVDIVVLRCSSVSEKSQRGKREGERMR